MDCDAERKFENPSVTTEANSFLYLVLHDVKGEGERTFISLFRTTNKKLFHFAVCALEVQFPLASVAEDIRWKMKMAEQRKGVAKITIFFAPFLSQVPPLTHVKTSNYAGFVG